jgi:GntR family transcriptional regulator / MocR family aminotransferase
VQPFTPGIADFSAFPLALWQRLQNKHWRMTYPDMLDYNASGGYAPLRRAITDYLRVFRSVHLDADQVVITTGTQQSLELCARLLADHGDTVWVEDPAYWGAAKALSACGQRIHPVPVDDEGICPGPSRRGATAAPDLRHALAPVPDRRRDVAGPAPPVAGHRAGPWRLGAGGRLRQRIPLQRPTAVLAAGPGRGRPGALHGHLFQGALSGPEAGLPGGAQGTGRSLPAGPLRPEPPGQMPTQAALAEFIEMGHFASALRKARQGYAERRRCLLKALQPVLDAPGGQGPFISGAEQGLHLCLRLPASVDDRALARQLAHQGLTVRPLSAYCLARQDLRGPMATHGGGYRSASAVHEWVRAG